MKNEKHRCYSVGVYVRESRDENEENYEIIETQRDLLVNFIKRNSIGEIASIYIDDNVSGSVFERDGIFSLRNDVEDGKIDMLVLKDLSRLGRNNARTLLFLDFLEEHGVRVITFDGKYDSTLDNDTVGIETWFNERYIRDISKKIRTSLRFKIERGEYIGHAPFGYRKSIEQKNKLIIDEDTASIVKEIYRLYREGYGYAYISKTLNSKGLASPAGGVWNATSICRILGNRVYVGDTVQGVSEKVSFKSKKRRRLPEEEWVVTKGTHESIISINEFNEVQAARKERRLLSGTHKGKLHVFRGIMFCGRCGSVMFARKRKNRPMGYICGNYCKNGKGFCTSHYINEKYIEDVIIEELLTLLDNQEIIKKLNVMYKNKSLGTCKNSNIENCKKAILSKKKQQETLYMDKLQGKISEGLFMRINKKLERDIGHLTDKMESMKNEQKESLKMESIVKFIKKDIIKRGVTLGIVSMMVDKITVFDEEDSKNAFCGKGLKDKFNEIKPQRGLIVIDFRLNKV